MPPTRWASSVSAGVLFFPAGGPILPIGFAAALHRRRASACAIEDGSAGYNMAIIASDRLGAGFAEGRGVEHGPDRLDQTQTG